MRAFEVFVANPSRARQVIDVFVNGTNVTVRMKPRDQAVPALVDIARAVSTLATVPRGKALVRFCDEPWELCVERLGGIASLSVYRTGIQPEVVVYDTRIPFADVVDGASEAVRDAMARLRVVPFDLRDAASRLQDCEVSREEPAAPDSEPVPASVDIDPDVPVSFAADFALRPGSDGPQDTIERADLHGLLFPGRLRAVVRGRACDLGDGYPFLFAERLLSVVQRLLTAFEQGRTLHVRESLGAVRIGVRLSLTGEAALALGTHTFPALDPTDVVFAALGFGRNLARVVVRRDRAQSHNLRLVALKRAIRETEEHLRDACRNDVKTNPRPEPYRAYVAVSGVPAEREPTNSTRLRYKLRWRALVPGIDLRATFLCGDRLVIGGGQETFCIDRVTGDVHWRVPTRKASSVPTPYGIARLGSDGELSVLDLMTGDVRIRAHLEPRKSGPPAGAVVGAPGLPKLLVLTEGERHLVAIDLLTGEARWRTSWGTGSVPRLKRLGKLIYCTSGDTAVSALDVQTGAVVWRVRDRLRFCGTPQAAHDVLFAVAGGVSGTGSLYAIDAFAGDVRFAAPLPGPDQHGDLREGGMCTVEGSPLVCGATVVVAVRDREGIRLVAFDRSSGAPAWSSRSTVAPTGTSWMAVDDVILGNTPMGELVAIDARDGSLRYRHVLGQTIEADVPRRLEPVLRGGAVYVPGSDVHVFRPSDGTPLGIVGPCETIPDLLRVDERCDVYVAEESGHMVCFGVASRLERIK